MVCDILYKDDPSTISLRKSIELGQATIEIRESLYREGVINYHRKKVSIPGYRGAWLARRE